MRGRIGQMRAIDGLGAAAARKVPEMIQWERLDTALVPGGGELRLIRRGAEYAIMLGNIPLMNSRLSGSEEALARLACARLGARAAPAVLIGGLGMGFTLRAALATLGPQAAVTVGELIPAVIAWARGPMAEVFAGCLEDPRVAVREADISALIRAARAAYDAILLDVDNGPEGLTRQGEYSDVSLTIREGEILGLTGLIGAGRTELGHTLFGMTRADSGVIKLNGKALSMGSNRDAVAAGIAYVSEDRLALGLVQPQSIADNLVLPVLGRISGRDGLISRKAKADLVAHWIRELAIKVGKPEDAVATLSGGNQQRVVLAKWLATEPKVLILDCPTVGVDVGARAGIYKIVRELAAQGLAILLISDEVSEVHFNADRILHMAGGRQVAEFDPRSHTLQALEEAVYA